MKDMQYVKENIVCKTQLGSFYVEFACSPCAFLGFLHALRLLPTVQVI